MEIYVLGYGGWTSPPHMGHTSIYVKTDVGILVDAGECTYARLTQCGLPWPDAIVISHRHGDHILGLPTFMLLAKRLGRRLTVVANREAAEAARTLAVATGIENALAYIDFVEASGEVVVGSTKLKFAKTAHTVETTAVRVEHGGRCVVYSSDTAPTAGVVELARGCDLLIHEASGNPGQEEEAHRVGHSTTADAVNIAREAGVRYLMPVHYYMEPPRIPPAIDIIVPIPCGKVQI